MSPTPLYVLWAQLSPAERMALINMCRPYGLWQMRALIELRLRYRDQGLANRGRDPQTVTRHTFIRWLVLTGRMGERCHRIGIGR